MATNEDRMKRAVVSTLESKNKLQVYGIRVDPEITYTLSTSSGHFNAIKSLLFPNSKHFTMVCDTSIETKEVNYKYAALLVIDNSVPAVQLQNDILNGLVQYIILSNTVYDVKYSPRLEMDIKSKIMNDPILKESVPGLINKKVLILYSPQIEAEMMDCTFRPHLFSGAHEEPEKTSMGSLVLKLDTNQQLVYLMGYMTPK